MPTAIRKVNLTDRSMRALRAPPDGRRYVVWDALMPGMVVRVSALGRRSFYVVKRRGDATQPTWYCVGEYPTMGLSEARGAARETLTALSEGKDPRTLGEAKRQAEEEALREEAKHTFAAVAERFIADYLPRLRSGRTYEARIRREMIPVLGSRPIAGVSRREIIALLDGIKARSGPEAARGTLVVLSKMLSWAISRDEMEANPARAISVGDVIGAKPSRDRLLSDAELAVVWRAADALRVRWPAFATVYQLLLLTGARRAEIGEARWTDLDLEAATLLVPAERAKNGAAQLIPLAPTATSLLDASPRLSGPYIFSGSGGRRPLDAYADAKAALDKEIAALNGAPLEPFVVHDFRRAVRSGLGRLGVAPVVAELCLGHRQRGIIGVYDRHSYFDEKRDALARWEQHLLGVVEPGPANVVPLRA